MCWGALDAGALWLEGVAGRGLGREAWGRWGRWTAERGAVLALALGVAGLAAAGWAQGAPGAFVLAGILLLAYAWPEAAVLLLPCALMASPRLPWGGAGDELLFVRLDHLLCFGAALRLLVRPGFAVPPGTAAGLLLFAWAAVCTALGVARGHMTPGAALLPLAQWVHLGLVYWVAAAAAPRLGRAGLYAWALPIIAAAGYGVAEIAWPLESMPGLRYRAFERGWFAGEANHFGGLFASAVVVGLMLATTRRHRVLGLGLAIAATAGLWSTGSRGSVIALAAGLAACAAWRWRWARAPLAAGAVAALLAFLWLPWEGALSPGSSLLDRLVAWKSALGTVPTHPLAGLGLGARHRSYYDNHYLLLLAETGLPGLLLLVLALYTVLRRAAVDTRADPALRAALFAALAVWSAHALSNVTFLITAVAGPAAWLMGFGFSSGADRAVEDP